jgi:inner membrane protein
MKLGSIVGSSTFRVFTIAGLILILLIPMGMIESVIRERGNLYRQANDDVMASWGKEQWITAPVISLPYLKQNTEQGIWTYDTLYKHIRPRTLDMDISIDTQLRYRSIYEVLLYTAHVKINGTYNLSDISYNNNESAEFEIIEGFIQVPMGDPKAIKEIISFTWDGIELEKKPNFLAGNEQAVTIFSEIDPEMLNREDVHEFSLEYIINGSGEVNFITNSSQTRLQLDANWVSPGFYGNYLPDVHSIANGKFTARWNVNELLGGIGHDSVQYLSPDLISPQSHYGVRFVQSVDTYQQVTRSAKYAVLIISLAFLVYFFTEIMTRLYLHPIQYILVGGVNCMFYLLLLSLAEHINFIYAYLLSAGASVSIVTLYSMSILKNRRYATVIFFLLGALYLYLYITLTSRAYALLIGSVGLFFILSLLMYLTRGVDWNKVNTKISANTTP